VSTGHGRLERRELRFSAPLAGSSLLPGLAQVAEVATQMTQLTTGQQSTCLRYLVTSPDATRATPSRPLSLSRDQWGIETRRFHVRDDSFGEDRHVLSSHTVGRLLGRSRATALNLLRGQAKLWTATMPRTARAEWVNAHPIAILAALGDFAKGLTCVNRYLRRSVWRAIMRGIQH
jgi:hypothetical protein